MLAQRVSRIQPCRTRRCQIYSSMHDPTQCRKSGLFGRSYLRHMLCPTCRQWPHQVGCHFARQGASLRRSLAPCGFGLIRGRWEFFGVSCAARYSPHWSRWSNCRRLVSAYPFEARTHLTAVRYHSAMSRVHRHTYGSIGKAQGVPSLRSVSSGNVEGLSVVARKECRPSWLAL